jgi:hypothetical protein
MSHDCEEKLDLGVSYSDEIIEVTGFIDTKASKVLGVTAPHSTRAAEYSRDAVA